MPGAIIRENRESRGFRIWVERAKPRITPAGTAQFHRFGYDVHDVQPGFYLINRGHRINCSTENGSALLSE